MLFRRLATVGVVLGCLIAGVLAVLAVLASAPVAVGATGSVHAGAGQDGRDAASARAFIASDLRADAAVARDRAAERNAVMALVKRVARECPKVLSGLPRQPNSLQASGVRQFLVQMLVTLDVDVLAPVRPAIERAGREQGRLAFSNPALAWSVHVYALSLPTLAKLEPPDLCPDAKKLASSHFIRITAAGRTFAQQASTILTTTPSETTLIRMMRPYAPGAVAAGLRRLRQLSHQTSPLKGVLGRLGRTLFGKSWSLLSGSGSGSGSGSPPPPKKFKASLVGSL